MSGEGPPISTKAKLDISEFASGVAELNRQIRVIQSGFQAATASMESWDKTSDGLQKRIAALTDEISIQQKKIEALRAEYTRVTAEKGADSRASQDLQVKVNQANEAFGKMQLELSQSQNKLKDLGDSSKTAGAGMKDLEGNTGKAGNSLGDLISTVKGFFAAIALDKIIDLLKGVVDGIINIGKEFAKMVMDSAAASDELQALADTTGLTTDQLQEMTYAASQLGMKSETMTSTFSKLARSIGSAKDQFTKYKDDMAAAAQAVADKTAAVQKTFVEDSAKWSAQLLNIAKTFSKQKTDLESTLNKSILDITKSTNKDLEKLQESHTARMADIQASIGDINANFEYERVKTKEETDTKIKRMDEDYAHDRLGLVDELNAAETDADKARIQKRLVALDYEHNLTRSRDLEDAAAAAKDAEYAREERIKALQDQLQAENKEYAKQNEQIKLNQAEQLQATKDRYQAELQAANERFQGEIDAARKAFAEIKAKRDEALASIKLEPAQLGPTAKAFQDLGVNIFDAGGKLRDVGDIWGDVITKLGGIPNETEKDIAAMELLGKSALELNPLIKAGKDEIEKLKDEAHKMGAVVDSETVKALANFNDKIEAIKLSIAGLKTDLAAVFSGEDVGKAIQKFADDINTKGPLMLESGKNLLNNLLDGFLKALNDPQTMGKLQLAAVNLGKWISANLPQILLIAFTLTVSIIYILEMFVVTVLSVMTKGLVDRSVDWMKKAAQGVIDNFTNGFNGLTDQIATIGKSIVDGVWQGIKDKKEEFRKNIQKFFQDMIDAVNKILHAGSPSQVFADIGANAGSSYVSGLGAALKAGTADLQRAFGNTALALNVNGVGGGAGGSSVVNNYHNNRFELTAFSSPQSEASLMQDIRLLQMLYGEA
jgi:predicted  nucleic acid-binding Zn-ribbon protein